MTAPDPQRPSREQIEQWQQHEKASLAKRQCPHSGELLQLDNPYSDAPPSRWSCEMCDCFGYDPTDPRIGASLKVTHPARFWWRGKDVVEELQVDCGTAHLDVRIKDGFTQIGYLDEEEYRASGYAKDLGDWIEALQWVAKQPWPEWTAP